MSSEIEKFIKKLSIKEQEAISLAIDTILRGDTASLDIKKLKGTEKTYRVRVGANRIIFEMKKGDITIIDVSRRSDTTYKL